MEQVHCYFTKKVEPHLHNNPMNSNCYPILWRRQLTSRDNFRDKHCSEISINGDKYSEITIHYSEIMFKGKSCDQHHLLCAVRIWSPICLNPRVCDTIALRCKEVDLTRVEFLGLGTISPWATEIYGVSSKNAQETVKLLITGLTDGKEERGGAYLLQHFPPSLVPADSRLWGLLSWGAMSWGLDVGARRTKMSCLHTGPPGNTIV